MTLLGSYFQNFLFHTTCEEPLKMRRISQNPINDPTKPKINSPSDENSFVCIIPKNPRTLKTNIKIGNAENQRIIKNTCLSDFDRPFSSLYAPQAEHTVAPAFTSFLQNGHCSC